jgi:ERCC4-type nuclease
MAGTRKSRPSEPAEIPIVIDAREQRPYRYRGAVVARLETGDYSVLGAEGRAAVERKSKQDAYKCLGQERARFEREMERLARLEFGAVVVEASLRDFLCAPAFTCMSPRAAVRTLLSWCVKYRVPVVFASDRRHARAATLCLLRAFWRYRMVGNTVRDPREGLMVR